MRALRVAVVEGGRIVDDRTFGRRRAITAGDLAVAGEGLGPRHPLFAFRRRSWWLVATATLRGRMTAGASPAEDIAVLLDRGGTIRRGELFFIPLGDRARGRIVVGGRSILFQVASRVPEPARLRIPMAIRAGWLSGIDRVFIGFGALSFALHFGLVLYLFTRDWPIESPIEVMADRFPEAIFEALPPPPAEGTGAPSRTPAPRATPPTANRAPVTTHPAGGFRDRAPPEAPGAMEHVGLNEILGSMLRGEGAVADIIRGGHASDLSSDWIGGRALDPSGDLGRLRLRLGAPGGAGPVAGLGPLAVPGGNASVGTRERGEREIHAHVEEEAPLPTGGTGFLGDDEIRRVIRDHMGAVRSCYERQLRHDPRLGGRLAMRITIGTSGAVGSARPAEDSMGDPEVARCVGGFLERMHFPRPEGGALTVTVPFVFRAAE